MCCLERGHWGKGSGGRGQASSPGHDKLREACEKSKLGYQVASWICETGAWGRGHAWKYKFWKCPHVGDSVFKASGLDEVT